MRATERILLCLLVLALFGAAANNAYACTCMRGGTVDVEFERAAFVAVLKLEGVGKTYKPERQRPSLPDRGQSIVSVRKIFKGDLKVGEKLVFRQLPSSMCGWSFDKADVGREFLFYLASEAEPWKKAVRPAIWSGSICFGSGLLDGKAGDLSYLENYQDVKGKTRVSGLVWKYAGDSIRGSDGHKITIAGNGRELELRTNQDGLYEAYDLPPGKYTVAAEPVEGYKLSYGKLSVEFEIQAGKHFEQDFAFATETPLR